MAKTLEYILKLEEHKDYGDMGLTICDKEGSQIRPYHEPAVSPLQFAHDLVEHSLKPHSDAFADEFIALGGLVFVRYDTGYIPETRYSRSVSTKDLHSDFVQLYNYMEYDMPSMGRNVIHDKDTRSRLEYLINEVLEHNDSKYPEDSVIELNKEEKRKVLNYMLLGYTETKKRYKYRWVATELFREVSNSFEKIKNLCEEGYQEVKLIIKKSKDEDEFQISYDVEYDEYYDDEED